jgi:hypothetical protein
MKIVSIVRDSIRRSLDEKHLTSAELNKREEIAKAMEKKNPGMPMSKKMAIATAAAKKVSEEVVDEGIIKGTASLVKHAVGVPLKTAGRAAMGAVNAVHAVAGGVKNTVKDVKDASKKVKAAYAEEVEQVEENKDSGMPNWYKKEVDKSPVLQAMRKQKDKENKKKMDFANRISRSSSSMKEDVDYEGSMAKTELTAIAAKASKVADMLMDESQLEAWVQSKISRAKDNIDAVHDYMVYSDNAAPAAMPTPYTAMSNPFMTREEVELDEAKRGRPRKDGSKPEGDDEHQEADQNIHTQLHKVISTGKSVTFNNGEKKSIMPAHAHKALSMLQNSKPSERLSIQHSLAHSHDRFHATIKSGKAITDAPRPKVSLAKSVREAVDPATITSDRDDIKTSIQIGADGRVKLVKHREPRKELKVESFSVEEENLLNNLYAELSETNKVLFKEMYNTPEGIEKLLEFAKEQGQQ